MRPSSGSKKSLKSAEIGAAPVEPTILADFNDVWLLKQTASFGFQFLDTKSEDMPNFFLAHLQPKP